MAKLIAACKTRAKLTIDLKPIRRKLSIDLKPISDRKSQTAGRSQVRSKAKSSRKIYQQALKDHTSDDQYQATKSDKP